MIAHRAPGGEREGIAVHRVQDLWSYVRVCATAPGDAILAAMGYFTVWALLFYGIAIAVLLLLGRQRSVFGDRLRQAIVQMAVVLALIVSLVGGCITYIHPRRLVIPLLGRQYVINEHALWFVDMAVHQLPLLLWVGWAMRTQQAAALCPGSVLAALALLAVYVTREPDALVARYGVLCE